MKYDSLRNTKRDKRIVRYAKAHPELSLQEIGDHFIGIKRRTLSKQSISRILRAKELK